MADVPKSDDKNPYHIDPRCDTHRPAPPTTISDFHPATINQESDISDILFNEPSQVSQHTTATPDEHKADHLQLPVNNAARHESELDQPATEQDILSPSHASPIEQEGQSQIQALSTGALNKEAAPPQALNVHVANAETNAKKYAMTTIAVLIIILVILCLLGSIASVTVYLLYENVEYKIKSTKLENRNERYGIEKGSVNAYIYDTVCLESDEDDDDATLILASNLHIENKFEPTGESILTNGTGMNEVYSYRHFSYIASITADIGFSFNFIMNQTDEQGTTTSTVCNKTITITNSSAFTLTCSSNVSGYYSAYVTVLNGTNGKITFNVSYNMININSYNNSNSKLCVIDKDTKKCSIHTVKHGYNRVIVGFNTQQNAVTLKYHKTVLILGVPLPVAAILIIVLIIVLVFCIAMWKCSTTCNKSKPTEASDQDENRDERDDVIHKDTERTSPVT